MRDIAANFKYDLDSLGCITRAMSKRILYLDASSLNKSSCLLRLRLVAAEGYRSAINGVSLEFGVAFHKFAETLDRTQDLYQSLRAAQEYFRKTKYVVGFRQDHMNEGLLIHVCTKYYEYWQQDNFKVIRRDSSDDNLKALVELKFAIPFAIEHDFEVCVCGTIDRIGRMPVPCIEDYKTTSSPKPDEFFESFYLSGQLHMYQYALRWYAKNHPDSIFSELVQTGRVGCSIFGVFLNKELDKCQLIRSPVFYISDEQVAQFERMLRDKVTAYLRLMRDNNWLDYREGILNNACETSKYGRQEEGKLEPGKCDFFGVCSAPDTRARQIMLETRFTKKPYNPLKFHE